MRLSVQIEFDKTLDLETPKLSVIVGRSHKSDLVIGHDSISRKHCKIDFIKNIFYITDLGSSNGTYIDGQRLEPQIRNSFDPSQQLMLGKIECEIAESFTPINGQQKIISSDLSTNGDYTATIRISRIDLNRPAKPIKMRNAPTPKKAIKDDKKVQKPKESNGLLLKKTLTITLIALALTVAWFSAPN